MNKIKALAIICERKNSKGIKNKNLSKIGEKSLIQICIEQALRCVEDVVVSSDSTEVLDIARTYDSVMIIDRPSDLAKDTTPKLPVLQHALKQVSTQYDIIFDLQPTSPLRTDESIFNSFNLFDENKNAENLISVSKTSSHPSYNLVTLNGAGRVKLLDEPLEPVTGRNFLPETFLINGVIYIWRKNVLMNKSDNKIVGNHTISYETGVIESIDIDTYEDLQLAEAIINTQSR